MDASWTSLSYCIDRNELNVGLRNVVRKLVKEFQSIDDEDFQFKQLAGGITNILYLVWSDKVPPRNKEIPVVVRIYGNNTETFIDRDLELQIQDEVFKQGVGPKFYGVFGNGCVYAFLSGRCVELEEIYSPPILRLIAQELGNWHNLNMSTKKSPSLWITLRKWADLAPRKFSDPQKSQKLVKLDVEKFRQEIIDLEEALRTLNSPIVFCHNDLLCKNIVISDAEDSIGFIDFEYASYNYRGFDLGNHFNEFAGFGPDYSLYPSKEIQVEFLQSYLAVTKKGFTAEDVELLYVEANQYSLASHLFWGFWALIQANSSDIDFDFLEYGAARFNRYITTKEQFLSLKPYQLSPSR